MRCFHQLYKPFIAVIILGCAGNDDSTLSSELAIGNGKPVTQQRSVEGPINEIIVAGNLDNVTINQGEKAGVTVYADSNLLKHVATNMQEKTLTISKVAAIASGTIEIVITLPNLKQLQQLPGVKINTDAYLTKLYAQQQSRVQMKYDSTASVTIRASGKSQITGSLTASKTEFLLSGGSSVTLQTDAAEISVQSSGGSTLDLQGGKIDVATLTRISGGSTIALPQLQTLTWTKLSGGSQVTYAGNPNITPDPAGLTAGNTIQSRGQPTM